MTDINIKDFIDYIITFDSIDDIIDFLKSKELYTNRDRIEKLWISPKIVFDDEE